MTKLTPQSARRVVAKKPAGRVPAATKRKPTENQSPALGFSAAKFRAALSAWYVANARKLPWRGVKDPYATWLSEIMLQQTRVAAVIDRYQEFLRKFPTLRALAKADEADVLALWSGLGYYRRARMLHHGAQFVVRELRGKLPRTAAELRTLPGVGDYTAAAIASIAFGQSVAVLDGNVERVLLRLLGRNEESSASAHSRLMATAQQLIPPSAEKSGGNPPGDHNQAMMELGATVCLPRSPLCLQCPVVAFCRTRGEHVTPQRTPQQSRVVAHLLVVRKRGVTTEVLLERRGRAASLMAGMMELPPLPLEATAGREPVLRLRHAITNTNYNVQIFAESARGVQPVLHEEQDTALVPTQSEEPLAQSTEDDPFDDDVLFVADANELAGTARLLDELPAAEREWFAASLLQHLPLTGLARKTLQRLGVMEVPKVQIG
jgi:A/G-specific adenine glycosylase